MEKPYSQFILLLFLFFSLVFSSFGQTSQQLIRIHPVANTIEMNAITNAMEGNLVYVQSEDQIYYHDGINWHSLSGDNTNGGWSLFGNSIDNNDFIGTTNNQGFRIRTDNSERMVVQNNGKVGINTTNPSGQLHVKSNGNVLSGDIAIAQNMTSYFDPNNATIYNIESMFDNNYDWGWTNSAVSAGALPLNVSFTIIFNSPRAISRYDISANDNKGPRDFTLHASNSLNGTQTLLDQRVNVDDWVSGQNVSTNTFSFNNNTAYTHYTFNITGVNGFNPNGFNIFELDMFELSSSNSDFIVNSNGKVGIGTENPSHELHVIGNILANGSITPDYVFEQYFEGESKTKPSYKFMDINKTMDFAQQQKHLPNIPSAQEIEKQGGIIINKAVEQNLEKIEELHIYIYQLTQEVERLKQILNEDN